MYRFFCWSIVAGCPPQMRKPLESSTKLKPPRAKPHRNGCRRQVAPPSTVRYTLPQPDGAAQPSVASTNSIAPEYGPVAAGERNAWTILQERPPSRVEAKRPPVVSAKP